MYTLSYSANNVNAAINNGDTRLAAFKAAIADGTQNLHDAFVKGVPVYELVPARAMFMDDVLRHAWQSFGLSKQPALSLIAVGGYGRGELHPRSDIDLLILSATQADEACQEKMSGFVTFLWDLSLDIGHSVRTLPECVEAAEQDITVASALMESRLLTGNLALFEQINELTNANHMWPPGEFYRAKWEEQMMRHNKYANTEYNLEPNVKNGPGGLRDIQMISWIAQRAFGIKSLANLVDLDLLTEAEYKALDEGKNYLWQVRWALHLVAGREEDRLLFDHQRTLAQQAGYEDSDQGLAVEQYMQVYYRTVLIFAELNDMLIQLLDEHILKAAEPPKVLALNPRFQIHNSYLEVRSPTVFEDYPPAILEAFVLMAQNDNIIGPRAPTTRLLREARHLIDDKFRQDPRNRKLFLQIINSHNKVASQLRRMNRYGILGKYLPEFGHIVGKMQHDLFHIYTVDAHTIQVVKNMRLFSYSSYAEKFPVAASIVKRLPNIELLYVAGLYHDIAKGRGGDHSELGAADARRFCQDHGFNFRQTELVVWLVRNHLIMSSTSQRKDISDPDVIREFALTVGDQENLDYLYVLTAADIYATNPELWNSWRASLLRQLYLETKRALRRGLAEEVDKAAWVDEAKEGAIRFLEDQGFDADDVINLWANPGDEYFLRESAQDIAWHTRALMSHNSDEPLVIVRDTTSRAYEGASQIFVAHQYSPSLFARTAALFERLNLSIQDARLDQNENGLSMNSYIVLEGNSEPVGANASRINKIMAVVTAGLTGDDSALATDDKLIPRQLKHFSYKPSVFFSQDEQKQQTIVELIAPDRPGLLARVGQVLMDNDIVLQNAKISTLGERVEDVFMITDTHNQPIEDDACLARLEEQLIASLSPTEETA